MEARIRKMLQQAQTLIKEKRYDEARKLLAKIDHPTARKWEQKLGDSAPKQSSRRGLLVFALIALIALGSVLAFVFWPQPVGVGALPTVAVAADGTSEQIVVATPTPNLTQAFFNSEEFAEQSTATAGAFFARASQIPATVEPDTTNCPPDAVNAWYVEASTALEQIAPEAEVTDPANASRQIQFVQRDMGRIPFPDCVETARSYFLRYLENRDRALNAASDADRAEYIEAASQALEDYNTEIDRILSATG